MAVDLAPFSTSTLESALVSVAQAQGGVLRTGRDAYAQFEARGHRVGSAWLHSVVNALVESGRAIRLERGIYAVADDLGRISPVAVGGHIVPGGFVSLWSAADFYDLTTQDVSMVSVITSKRHPPIAAVELDAFFAFHVTSPDRLFGWHDEPINGTFARIADVERLLIDLLLFQGPGVPEPEQVRAIWRSAIGRANPYVLVDYARRLAVASVARRVGYLMDEVGLGPTRALEGWRAGDRHPVALFPSSPSSAELSTKWGVYG
jgi:predicted transcriptional regulator of viral defense system